MPMVKTARLPSRAAPSPAAAPSLSITSCAVARASGPRPAPRARCGTHSSGLPSNGIRQRATTRGAGAGGFLGVTAVLRPACRSGARTAAPRCRSRARPTAAGRPRAAAVPRPRAGRSRGGSARCCTMSISSTRRFGASAACERAIRRDQAHLEHLRVDQAGGRVDAVEALDAARCSRAGPGCAAPSTASRMGSSMAMPICMRVRWSRS